MRSVVWTATLAAALWVATPGRAVAQDPEPPPAPAPPPREVAVPRAERVRMRDTETEGKVANESAEACGAGAQRLERVGVERRRW